MSLMLEKRSPKLHWRILAKIKEFCTISDNTSQKRMITKCIYRMKKTGLHAAGHIGIRTKFLFQDVLSR